MSRAALRLLAIHTKEGGERTLRLQLSAVAKDALTGQKMGEGTMVPLTLEPSSTTILQLGNW